MEPMEPSLCKKYRSTMDDQYSISGLAAFFFPVLDVDSDWRHLLYLSLKASLPSHVNEIGSFFLGLRKLQNSIYTNGIRRSCQKTFPMIFFFFFLHICNACTVTRIKKSRKNQDSHNVICRSGRLRRIIKRRFH